VAVSSLSEDIQNRIIEAYHTGEKPITMGTRVCVFKPRVQVIDNWGYCNGECDGGDGGDYCYTSTPEYSTGECVWPEDNNFADAANTPWTTYKGSIIIVPEDRPIPPI